jgi:polysaccharide biosynthesis/export protein
MKVAIRSAVLAASAVILCAAVLAQSKPAEAAPAQEQAKPGEAVPAGPQAALPAVKAPAAPAATDPVDPSKSPAVEADPAKPGQPAVKVQPTNTDPSYVIGAEDVLGVQVWGDNRLTGSYLVRPDGRISIALIGELTATGLTPSELETAISDLLKQKDILRRPQVTVQVNQINSKKYFLQGEVLKTGAFPLVVPTTILEALVNAGGFKDFANTKKIEVIRGKERLKFNYKDVIHGKHTEQNIKLKPGDIIIVP